MRSDRCAEQIPAACEPPSRERNACVSPTDVSAGSARVLPTFATFYTDDAYQEAAGRLEACCRHFGLPFKMLAGVEFGSWRRNCNQKPRVLRQLRGEISGPIVWLDADCIIHSPPRTLLREHAEDAILWAGGISEKHYICSQVMWWNDTATARAMIADWSERSAANPESLADPLLKATCEAWRGAANVGVLPAAYLKPYWKSTPEVRSEEIVISGNERCSVHSDAVPRQVRLRLDPLRLPCR